jgi:hypothetical protein
LLKALQNERGDVEGYGRTNALGGRKRPPIALNLGTMTPAEFAAKYNSTAHAVGRGTGIDNVVLLAQWANETAWGTVVVGNNLGNIRCSPTTFCRYATLDDSPC